MIDVDDNIAYKWLGFDENLKILVAKNVWTTWDIGARRSLSKKEDVGGSNASTCHQHPSLITHIFCLQLLKLNTKLKKLSMKRTVSMKPLRTICPHRNKTAKHQLLNMLNLIFSDLTKIWI